MGHSEALSFENLENLLEIFRKFVVLSLLIIMNQRMFLYLSLMVTILLTVGDNLVGAGLKTPTSMLPVWIVFVLVLNIANRYLTAWLIIQHIEYGLLAVVGSALELTTAALFAAATEGFSSSDGIKILGCVIAVLLASIEEKPHGSLLEMADMAAGLAGFAQAVRQDPQAALRRSGWFLPTIGITLTLLPWALGLSTILRVVFALITEVCLGTASALLVSRAKHPEVIRPWDALAHLDMWALVIAGNSCLFRILAGGKITDSYALLTAVSLSTILVISAANGERVSPRRFVAVALIIAVNIIK
jgi:hypothetical protein